MRVVLNLTIALIAGTLTILAGNRAFRVRREVDLFRSERVRDDKLVGAALAAMWRTNDEAEARAMLAQVSAREDKLAIRWIEGADQSVRGEIDRLLLCDVETAIVTDARGREARRTFVSVIIDDHRSGVLEALAAKTRVMLVTSALEGGAPVIAEADAGQIQQVITNLVVNAVQAMTRPGEVRVAVAREGDHVCVRVREGRGVAPEDLPHVFEPFFTTKDVGQGTGLGLSLAYGIVRELGGWMDARSTLGAGSVFSAWLPATEAK